MNKIHDVSMFPNLAYITLYVAHHSIHFPTNGIILFLMSHEYSCIHVCAPLSSPIHLLMDAYADSDFDHYLCCPKQACKYLFIIDLASL